MNELKRYIIIRQIAPWGFLLLLVTALCFFIFYCHYEIYNLFCQTEVWVDRLNQYEAVKIVTDYTGKLNSSFSVLLLWIEIGVFLLLGLFYIVRRWFVNYCLATHEGLAYRANQNLVLQRNIERKKEETSGLSVNMTAKDFPEFKVRPGSFPEEDSYDLLNLRNCSFCHFSFLAGDFWAESFEKRDTDVWKENEENKDLKLKMACIYTFYENLKKQAGDKELKAVFTRLQEVYSEANLKEAIIYVNKHRYELGMAFIGDKIGLLDYEVTPEKTILYVYKTDHFTWKVCKYLYEKHRQVFVEVFRLIHRYADNVEKRSLLMRSLFLLFSSMGVDAIVHGRDSRGVRRFLMTLRSGRLHPDGVSRIHVSVDEAFSFTDMEGNVPYCDLWLKRGVAEEIGYPGMSRDNLEMRITFYDFAITYDLGEVGLCADVELKHIDRVSLFPAQDKYLESEGLFCIPFPYRWYNLYKFWLWSNPMPTYIQKVIRNVCRDERLKMKWVSFAPLVYARFFIRQFSPKKITGSVLKAKKKWWIAINIAIVLSLLFTEEIINSQPLFVWIFIMGVVVVFLLLIWVWRRKKNGIPLFKSNMEPLVPQWTGNVKVLQNTVASHPYEGRNIYLKGTSGSLSEKLDHYVVRGEPKCAVRASNNNSEEVPMVFFNIAPMRYEGEKGRIRFPLFHITHDKLYYYQLYELQPGAEKGREHAVFRTISFIFSESEVSLCKAEIDGNLYSNLHYYFNLPKAEFVRNEEQEGGTAKDDALGNIETPHETPCEMTDLFQFNGDFYFISKVKSQPGMDEAVRILKNKGKVDRRNTHKESGRELEKYTGIDAGALEGYRVVTDTASYLFVLYGFQLEIENERKRLVKKIIKSWMPVNGRLSELEVLALQFLLARNEPAIYVGK